MVASFSYDLQDDPIVEQFSALAAQEGLDRSKLLIKLVKDYVVKHGNGNPAFVLTKWVEEPKFMAFPTMGEILAPDRLDKLPDKDLEDLEKISRARRDEIVAAVERRQIKKFGKIFHSGTKATRPPWND